MIARNFRHLRLFLSVAELESVTLASGRHNVSQPAVTQALGKMERQAGSSFFTRTRQGFFLTPQGEILAGRVRRAFERLDPVLAEMSPRMERTATSAQLTALIAVCETQNFTLAARKLGLAQPTVHRAVGQLEQESDRALFQRTAFGITPTRHAQALAQAAQLAFSELDQAEADLAEYEGREAGQIVIGALPLSRSVLLPQVLARFRTLRPTLPIKVIDGPYSDLLAGLRRGDIDFILGALRDPPPIGDVVQERLFDDTLSFVVRPDHPLAARRGLRPADIEGQSWVVPRAGSPTRQQFDAFFARETLTLPGSVLETGSILFMREYLALGDALGCISAHQAAAETAKGLLAVLDLDAGGAKRPIGLTTRSGWQPTRAQGQLLDLLREHTSKT